MKKRRPMERGMEYYDRSKGLENNQKKCKKTKLRKRIGKLEGKFSDEG